MKIYLVGGAVRDGLLGAPVDERDWVVVGGDENAMRARGYVAADQTFPVFLHPDTGEEYALARREVKRGEGYRGFEVDAGPDVTLEEDLQRRDLTINAMAQDEAGTIIDPYGGRADLHAGLLRHVSDAFVEDPLRVLRVARFAAKLGEHGFRVAHGTHHLMRRMVEDGEMGHLQGRTPVARDDGGDADGSAVAVLRGIASLRALQVLIAPLAVAMGEPCAHANDVDSPPIAALKRATAASADASCRVAATLLACINSVSEAEALMSQLRSDRGTAQLFKRATAGRSAYRAAGEGDVDALLELVGLWRGYDPGAGLEAPLAVCEAQTAQPVVGQYLQAGPAGGARGIGGRSA